MDFDRNRYFMVGLLIFLLGVQFRMVESVVLNESSTRALAKFAKDSQLASTDLTTEMYLNYHPSPRKTVKPPHWLGWALLTAGGVCCLHALALPRPRP